MEAAAGVRLARFLYTACKTDKTRKGVIRMRALAYYDGRIGTPEELTVPFNDRVHFFGDGCYEASIGGMSSDVIIGDVQEDNLGRMWVATDHSGLFIIDYAKRELYNYNHDKANESSVMKLL